LTASQFLFKISHTIAQFSRQSNVCFKSLAVLEGKGDGKVTHLIILQQPTTPVSYHNKKYKNSLCFIAIFLGHGHLNLCNGCAVCKSNLV
jgi:hypothetical protein